MSGKRLRTNKQKLFILLFSSSSSSPLWFRLGKSANKFSLRRQLGQKQFQLGKLWQWATPSSDCARFCQLRDQNRQKSYTRKTKSRRQKSFLIFEWVKRKSFFFLFFAVLKCLHPPLMPLRSHTHTHFNLSRTIKMKFILFYILPISSIIYSQSAFFFLIRDVVQRDFDFLYFFFFIFNIFERSGLSKTIRAKLWV